MKNNQLVLCVNRIDYIGFIEREYAESVMNKEWKQIIPYITMKNKDKYLLFRRANGNESRLHNKCTIGIGGHIDIEDWSGDFKDTLANAARREILEETGIIVPESKKFVFKTKIVLMETDVDFVHIGYNAEISVSDEDVDAIKRFCERDGSELEFIGEKTIQELKNMAHELENWSKYLVFLPKF